MREPPETVGGARVLCFVDLADCRPTGRTIHRVDGVVLERADGLAIGRYEGSSECYLFHCDQDWRVLTDTVHFSVEDARAQAEFEYGPLPSSRWHVWSP